MRFAWALISLLLLVGGCGVYSFHGEGVGGIKSIAVEPFDNKTTEFGVRESLADALIARLLSDRTLTIASPAVADAILTGSITSLQDRPLTYSAGETVSEYQISLTVSFTLGKRGGGEPLWEGSLTGESPYAYTPGGVEQRRDAINKALDKIVQDLINRLTSDW